MEAKPSKVNPANGRGKMTRVQGRVSVRKLILANV